MSHYLTKIILCLSLLMSAHCPAVAVSSDPIQTWTEYWDALACGRIAEAALSISPSDLEARRRELLPLFLAARQHRDAKVRTEVGHFFATAPGTPPKDFTGAQVFVGIASFAALPAEVCKASLTKLSVKLLATDSAVVSYSLKLGDTEVEDDDPPKLQLIDGKWYIRLPELGGDEQAQAFKKLLANP